LFGLARALPFLVDAISYVFSTVSLLAMRTPFQEHRQPGASPLRARLAEGFRFLWGHPFLRTCALLFGLANFVGPGVLLAVVVTGRRQGLPGGQVGASSTTSRDGECLPRRSAECGQSVVAVGAGSRRRPGGSADATCYAADLHRVAARLMAIKEAVDEPPVVLVALREPGYGHASPAPEEGRGAIRAAPCTLAAVVTG